MMKRDLEELEREESNPVLNDSEGGTLDQGFPPTVEANEESTRAHRSAGRDLSTVESRSVKELQPAQEASPFDGGHSLEEEAR